MLSVSTKWLIRANMERVLQIEKECFEIPWVENDFLNCLRQRNNIGMVAEHDQEIVGFVIYGLENTRLRLLNFAVAPEARRRQVGSQMVQKLIDKLSQQRRHEIVLEVRETNVPAQLFFKAHGFRAIDILRGHYDDTTEDAYVMRYHLNDPSEARLPAKFRNRISSHIKP